MLKLDYSHPVVTKKQNTMNMVSVSPDFQILIPTRVCQSLGIAQGEKFQVLRYGDRIELIPISSAKSMRGFLKGIIERESDRL
jgi:AbrB family looped-hinge helix DNA binding protein